MKVWMLYHDGEGMPVHNRLFREDNPPSIEKIRSILIEWDSDYMLEEKLEAIKSSGRFHGNYESCGLELRDVE